jgi:hypothetical protein
LTVIQFIFLPVAVIQQYAYQQASPTAWLIYLFALPPVPRHDNNGIGVALSDILSYLGASSQGRCAILALPPCDLASL